MFVSLRPQNISHLISYQMSRKSATLIKATYRMYVAHKFYVKQLESAAQIQAFARMIRARKAYLKMRKAALTFQRFTRMWKVQVTLSTLIYSPSEGNIWLSVNNFLCQQAKKVLEKLKFQKAEAERRRREIQMAEAAERARLEAAEAARLAAGTFSHLFLWALCSVTKLKCPCKNTAEQQEWRSQEEETKRKKEERANKEQEVKLEEHRKLQQKQMDEIGNHLRMNLSMDLRNQVGGNNMLSFVCGMVMNA